MMTNQHLGIDRLFLLAWQLCVAAALVFAAGLATAQPSVTAAGSPRITPAGAGPAAPAKVLAPLGSAPASGKTPAGGTNPGAGGALAVGGAPGPTATGAGPVSAITMMPKLEVHDTLGVYQARAKLRATFTGSDGKPAQGKPVEFRVGGKPAGSAQTGADGVAVLEYVVPESLPAGANPMEARLGTLTAKGNLGISKAAAQLALGVFYAGNEAVAEQGQSVTLRGHLRPASQADAVAARLVRITVDGKEIGTDKTNASGMFELKYPVPVAAAKNLEASARFEGDAHYLATVSTAVQIHTKPASNRLPPPVTQGPGIHAVGVNSLPPALTAGPAIHAVGINSLPAAVTQGPAIHAVGVNSLPQAVTQGPSIHAVGATSLPPALTVGPNIRAVGFY